MYLVVQWYSTRLLRNKVMIRTKLHLSTIRFVALWTTEYFVKNKKKKIIDKPRPLQIISYRNNFLTSVYLLGENYVLDVQIRRERNKMLIFSTKVN